MKLLVWVSNLINQKEKCLFYRVHSLILFMGELSEKKCLFRRDIRFTRLIFLNYNAMESTGSKYTVADTAGNLIRFR